MKRASTVASKRSRVPRGASGETRIKADFARDFSKRTKTLKRVALDGSSGYTPDEIHELRVTTRRLRASLSILRKTTSDDSHRTVRRELRDLTQTLGGCRTLDIAIRDATRYRRETKTLEKRRAKASAAVDRALKSSRVNALHEELRDLEAVIAQAAFERLSPWLQQFEWEMAYLLETRPRTAEARHDLRIQMKKVRYVIEALGRNSPSIRRLQDALGKEHDLVVLQTLLGRIPKAAQDQKRARAMADRVMVSAVRSAMLHLRAIRRALTR